MDEEYKKKVKRIRIIFISIAAVFLLLCVVFLIKSEPFKKDPELEKLKKEIAELGEDAEKARQNVEDIKKSVDDIENGIIKKTEREPMSYEEEFQSAHEDALIYTDSIGGFSRQHLIEQLSSEYGGGYSLSVAVDVVDYIEEHNEVDWNEQAAKAAEKTLSSDNTYSREDLIYLLSESTDYSYYLGGFTQKQAEYAADQVGLTE